MEHLTLDTDGGVAILRMNYRAENRFSLALLDELMPVLDTIEADDAIGALVLTGGDPKFFSNGLDIEWLVAQAPDFDAMVAYMERVNAMYRRFCAFGKPTVGALNGHAFAGGLFLSAHLDFRLMREDRGWICMPEVDINIPLLPGMIAICEATMPARCFRTMYYTGERFTGPKGVEMGFVDGVFAEDALLPASVELATKLAGKKPRTYAEMKNRLRAPVLRALDEEDPAALRPTLEFALGM